MRIVLSPHSALDVLEHFDSIALAARDGDRGQIAGVDRHLDRAEGDDRGPEKHVAKRSAQIGALQVAPENRITERGLRDDRDPGNS